MTQDISIAHHGATGTKAGARRAELTAQDQADSPGARALAVLFIGFAVYLKSFFTASQAENLDQSAAEAGPVQAPQPRMTDHPAALAQAGSPAEPAPDHSTAGSARDTATGFPVGPSGIVAPAPFDTAGESGASPAQRGMEPGRIARDQAQHDLTPAQTGFNAQPSQAGGLPGTGRPDDRLASAPVTTFGNDPVSDSSDGLASLPSDRGHVTPDAAGHYDIASLFQDMGATLQNRPDQVVDRVTDLAIGDLMREMTLEEFRAHLGQVPQDSGRPLDILVSVLTDAGARDAFLTRVGLTGFGPDTVAPTDTFDMFHQPPGAEPPAGQDLFL
jgi:hypothetical protein